MVVYKGVTMLTSVKTAFMEFGELLEKEDFEESLKSRKYLSELNSATTELYVLINTGFCELPQMSKTCHENRDQIENLMKLMDDCDGTGKVSAAIISELNYFKLNIPTLVAKFKDIQDKAA